MGSSLEKIIIFIIIIFCTVVTTCLHMNDLDQIICNDYRVGRINSVTRITHPTLFCYYRLFMLLLEKIHS